LSRQPKADIPRCDKNRLFDHLVGSAEQGAWHSNTKCLGGS
jgi:hypothetical protein